MPLGRLKMSQDELDVLCESLEKLSELVIQQSKQINWLNKAVNEIKNKEKIKEVDKRARRFVLESILKESEDKK